MDCPVCRDVKLAMTDRQGIEIDYCPQCRGIWLDRGELDKLIERASADTDRPAPQARTERGPPPPPPPQYDSRDAYRGHQDGYRHKKKKNLLGELFDF